MIWVALIHDCIVPSFFKLRKDLFFPNHTLSFTEAWMTSYIKGNGRTNEHYLL